MPISGGKAEGKMAADGFRSNEANSQSSRCSGYALNSDYREVMAKRWGDFHWCWHWKAISPWRKSL